VRVAPSLTRILLGVYLALWAITIAGAALTALLASGPARALMRLALSPADNPPPSLGHVLALAAHNLPICAWPLLLGFLRLPERSAARRAADVLLLASALANIAPVAVALGSYGWALAPYIPQLPLEWAALAVGYGSWVAERERALTGRGRLWLASMIGALLLTAAALETCAVPHR
jgi:hypothetical protein